MDSKLNNQNDLLHQLKVIHAEKELLEKHVFVLNECLSIDELRTKISHLEKKKKMLSSLEELIGGLRVEIEPLKYLKSILKNKLEFEDQNSNLRSQSCVDLKPNVSSFDTNISKTSLCQSTFNIPTDAIKKVTVSSQNLYDVLSGTSKTPNTDSIVIDNSLDEYMQFLDQYDTMTNFLKENHSKIQNDGKELISAQLNIEQNTTTNTNFEAEGMNIKLKNDENLSLTENVESFMNNLNIQFDSYQFQEATSSKPFKNQKGSYSDPHMTIGDDSDSSLKFKTIDYSGPPSMDVSGITQSEEKEVLDNFDEMNLKEELMRGFNNYGFQKPLAILQRTILPCITGQNVIAQALTSTDRTATFSISILQKIDSNLKECQALILAPTRLLAQQIQKMINALGYFMKVNCHACIGGTNIHDDKRKLDTGPHVVVGTPGRVKDMIARKSLQTKFIKIFVLDEADFSRDFRDQIKEVFKFFNDNIQIIMLSATMPEDVLEFSTHLMRNPVKIFLRKEEEITLEGIKQFYIKVTNKKYKFETLCDFYVTLSITQTVIFCNTRQRVKGLAKNMRLKKFPVSEMHGDLDQQQRELVIHQFCSGSNRVLITTDLMAQNIDRQVSMIINYDLPSNCEKYIHRISYLSRYGQNSVIINIITEDEKKTVKDIESFYNTHILEMPQNVADLL